MSHAKHIPSMFSIDSLNASQHLVHKNPHFPSPTDVISNAPGLIPRTEILYPGLTNLMVSEALIITLPPQSLCLNISTPFYDDTISRLSVSNTDRKSSFLLLNEGTTHIFPSLKYTSFIVSYILSCTIFILNTLPSVSK